MSKYAGSSQESNSNIGELWKYTNPLVAFLSKIRPPLEFDSEVFLRRIKQEGGLPKGVQAETLLNAVFAATKDELSNEKIAEISKFLPDTIQKLWDGA